MSEETVAERPQPRFFDTYALIYAFIMVFLIPGLALMSRMPFRDYTFQYVTVFALPFVLGMTATFLTDSRDALRTRLIRTAILIPLVTVTGVTVLFTGALTVVPISPYLKSENFAATTPYFAGLLMLLAVPLVFAVVARVRVRPDWRTAIQLLALLVALSVVALVGYEMLSPAGDLRGFARKDITIYVTGAVMWYLPSFGIAAGAWRMVGMV